MKDRLASRWFQVFRATVLMSLGMVGFGAGSTLVCADDSIRTNSSSVTVAALEYQETAYTILNRSISITPQSALFKKEPPAAPGKILRGVLNLGAGFSNAIPFVWQRGAGKLYLDLNHNRDLTDDPSGVFSARAPVEGYQQTFTNVHLPFDAVTGAGSMLADLEFVDSGVVSYCTVGVRSFWQGRLTLQGRDWQVGLVPNSSRVSLEASQLLLRPWTERDKAFNVYGGSLDTLPFSRKLFVDGRAYQLICIVGPKNGPAKLALQFTEQPVALGELKITGQFIRRVVLPGGSYLVVLDQPAGSVKVPVGSYNPPEVQLEQGGVEAFGNSSQLSPQKLISVNGKTAAVVTLGGPLTNTVTATRQGRDLRLDYQLVGAGGGIYQLAQRDYSKPPAFAIYKGDRKIASGNFEFG